MRDIRPGIRNIPSCPRQDTLVIITIEQRILCVFATMIPSTAPGADSIRLKACLDTREEGKKKSMLNAFRIGIGMLLKHNVPKALPWRAPL
jgi:hypothetical protein